MDQLKLMFLNFEPRTYSDIPSSFLVRKYIVKGIKKDCRIHLKDIIYKVDK